MIMTLCIYTTYPDINSVYQSVCDVFAEVSIVNVDVRTTYTKSSLSTSLVPEPELVRFFLLPLSYADSFTF